MTEHNKVPVGIMTPGSDGPSEGGHPELIDALGPGPFITKRTYRRADGTLDVWQSRHHRKGLSAEQLAVSVLLRGLWMPRHLNWWIGVVFALGSSLFFLGSVLSLSPSLSQSWSLDPGGVNAIFFAGSLAFTAAAYLQLFQAANADAAARPRGTVRAPRQGFGWRPHDIGWLACALQLAGAVLFNVNTADALLPGLDWLQEDLAVWVPDLLGSVLFLASGYLAFVETVHSYFAWNPFSISWWITFVNLLACVAFMISAMFAFTLPRAPDATMVSISVTFTLVGSAGFLLGALLLLPETALARGET